MSKGMNMFISLGTANRSEVNKGHKILSYNTVYCPKAKKDYCNEHHDGVVKGNPTSAGIICSHCGQMVY